MGSYEHKVYGGTNYGMDPDYGTPLGGVSFSQFGTAVNAQSANQLNEVSRALNSGLKTVEVQMTFPNIEKAITNEHLEDLNRLRKLTGVNLTLHGPMVDPVGVSGGEGRSTSWSEQNRVQAERRMSFAVNRGKKIDPDGNLVVTLHASVSTPEEEVKIKKDGKEIVTHIGAVDTQSGAVGMLEVGKKDFLTGEKTEDIFKKMNGQSWFKRLQSLSHQAYQGSELVDRALKSKLPGDVGKAYEKADVQQLYGDFVSGKLNNELGKYDPNVKKDVVNKMEDITHGDLYLRDAYSELKSSFNDAWRNAEKEDNKKDLAKLQAFSEEVKKNVNMMDDPSKVGDFGKFLIKGVNVLRTIEAPQIIQPIKQFALDKASETFSNVAFKAYEKFGDKAPIISLENHPFSHGTSFNRAEHLRDLIKETRVKFVKKAMGEGMSKGSAEREAEKLIGVTWDVGHINTLKSVGYDDEDLAKQTKTIAPYIKHVHLADNFGLEDAELAMGQGNVPIKKHEEMLKKYGKMDPKEIKRIVEAFDSVSQFGGASPLPQVLSHYGAPVYQIPGEPYWNQLTETRGGYFGGYGNIMPDVSFRNYGAGFDALPVELGGPLPGGGGGFGGAPLT